jgi:glutamate carboxypeptidase
MAREPGLRRLLLAVEQAQDDFLADLERIVDVDSSAYSKAGVDAVGDLIAERLAELGGRVQRVPHARFGDTIVGEFERGRDGPRVLMVGHMDTVFEEGTAAERPFAVRGGRAYGPGVSDMKAGLLAGVYAIGALRSSVGGSDGQPRRADRGWLPVGRLVFIANPDEEIGSPSSGAIIREHAERSDAALVLEAARANGDIVSARKGQMDVRIDVVGRAAHSGVEPEAGHSAVVEAAHQIIAIDALDGRFPGVTVNAGVIHGGTRPNVVAARATIEIDVRATERTHLQAVETLLRQIADEPTVPDVRTTVEVTGRQWPMRPTAASRRLVRQAVSVARALGFELQDAATGGSSDANAIAELGIPTIDGLGPVGGLDHTPDEYIELDSIVPRIALLAGIIAAIGTELAEG